MVELVNQLPEFAANSHLIVTLPMLLKIPPTLENLNTLNAPNAVPPDPVKLTFC
jgi:hypothetical protein